MVRNRDAVPGEKEQCSEHVWGKAEKQVKIRTLGASLLSMGCCVVTFCQSKEGVFPRGTRPFRAHLDVCACSDYMF